MKRPAVWAILLMATIIGLGSCYKDIIKPELASNTEGPPQPVSFKNELAPLFNSSCALAGCHVSGGHHPYMNTDISYQQIVNGGFVNTDFPKESILYKMINTEMAQYIPSASDRQKVYDWIRNGAPNN
ncbi:MAG: hypothetical protein J0H29_05665 [Sphingobacteriales bacterium]|nr:hypothetical protein [Sphingobacteriales bacterium]OJY92325.1 MAG: hypothetical protein BGP14_14020 [Sphingobacteriales bacterium 44-15]